MLHSDQLETGRSDAGFTLAELLIVLVILSLVLAVSAPAFGRLLPARADSLALERFHLTLDQTRRRAARTGGEAVFVMNVRTGQYGISGSNILGRLPEAWSIKVNAARSEQVSSDEVGIRYWPTGASTGGEVTLIHNGETTQINVDWLTGVASRERAQ